MSQASNQDGQRGEIVVAYTVWSRKRGAGREIITKLREWTIQNNFKKTSYTITFNTGQHIFILRMVQNRYISMKKHKTLSINYNKNLWHKKLEHTSIENKWSKKKGKGSLNDIKVYDVWRF